MKASAHSERSWQGLVAPPVMRQAAAQEIGAVGGHQASRGRCAALVEVARFGFVHVEVGWRGSGSMLRHGI